jgi:hypothetical protein
MNSSGTRTHQYFSAWHERHGSKHDGQAQKMKQKFPHAHSHATGIRRQLFTNAKQQKAANIKKMKQR